MASRRCTSVPNRRPIFTTAQRYRCRTTRRTAQHLSPRLRQGGSEIVTRQGTTPVSVYCGFPWIFARLPVPVHRGRVALGRGHTSVQTTDALRPTSILTDIINPGPTKRVETTHLGFLLSPFLFQDKHASPRSFLVNWFTNVLPMY